jgi:2-dehydropantoate 2-reductase
MKIAILGAGAMGCAYGAMLAEGGESEVRLIDIWADHVKAINTSGLKVSSAAGDRIAKGDIKAFTSPDEVGPSDLVIVFVKAITTGDAMRKATCLVGPETMVLTLQNGLGNVEKLCSVIDKSHVIAGTASGGANIKGPGHIHHAAVGETTIGELDGSDTPRLAGLAAHLNRAGLVTKLSHNVLGLIWTKLIVNIGINALCTLTRLRNGQLLDYPGTESLLELAVSEAAAVAKAKGIKLECSDAVAHCKDVAARTGKNICSMLQDFNAKRTTEIAVINGAVVDAGLETGVATPFNLTLTNLVKTLQESYDQRP